MLTHWRVVKMSTNKNYAYVALEFDMSAGTVNPVRVKANETDVRKRRTTEFEILENNEWLTIPYKEVRELMWDFNVLRIDIGLEPLTEDDILKKLYFLEELR